MRKVNIGLNLLCGLLVALCVIQAMQVVRKTTTITLFYDVASGMPIMTSEALKCQNLTLTKTAKCLNLIVRSIYKYKETPDLRQVTYEQLKEQGGDCLNYASLYTGMAGQVGLYSRNIAIPMTSQDWHGYSVISNKEGYCIMDQKRYVCFLNQYTEEDVEVWN